MTAGPVRAWFREGGVLRADDLRVEQHHRVASLRWHRRGAHGWGVVRGLELREAPPEVRVEPGLAVDGYGRVLVLDAPVEITADDVADAGAAAQVWLTTAPASAGTSVCLTPGDGRDPRFPPGVPGGGPPPPEALGGDEPPPWPVYLGSVAVGAAGVEVPEDGAVRATLTGEEIRGPSGRARLQVGTASGGARLAVSTRTEGEDGELRDRLTVDARGDVAAAADGECRGDARVRPVERLRGPDRGDGVAFGVSPGPVGPAPWTIARPATARAGRELRIEIAHPGDEGDPARSRLTAGADDGGAFRPCLSVAADCTVTVHGDLTVEGTVREGPIGVDPADPRFADAVSGRWLQGAAGTGALVDAYYGAGLTVCVDLGTAQAGSVLHYEVWVSTTGNVPATSGQIHVVVALDDDVRERRMLAGDLTFPAGRDTIETATFPVPAHTAGRRLTVAAMALGVGPAGNVVSGQGSAAATVQANVIPS